MKILSLDRLDFFWEQLLLENKPGSLAADEVQTSVKFDNCLSRLWGEGGPAVAQAG
jgi:hypothetical protein